MRKLVLKMSLSADGFVGGPNGELDWLFRYMDESSIAWQVSYLWQAGVHIMGSRTFHDMAAYWPTSSEAFTAPMNAIPKVVFSKKGFIGSTNEQITTKAVQDARRYNLEKGISPTATADTSTWVDVPIASGDLAEEIHRLKQQEGKSIIAHGGASFAQSLVRLDLVDEYCLLIHPVFLGRGLPLFSALQNPLHVKLESSTMLKTGIIANIYKPITK